MSINTRAASVPQLRQFPADTQVSEATRFAQFAILDEIEEPRHVQHRFTAGY